MAFTTMKTWKRYSNFFVEYLSVCSCMAFCSVLFNAYEWKNRNIQKFSLRFIGGLFYQSQLELILDLSLLLLLVKALMVVLSIMTTNMIVLSITSEYLTENGMARSALKKT